MGMINIKCRVNVISGMWEKEMRLGRGTRGERGSFKFTGMNSTDVWYIILCRYFCLHEMFHNKIVHRSWNGKYKLSVSLKMQLIEGVIMDFWTNFLK